VPKSIGNLALADYGDIFGNADIQPDSERIMQIPLADLYPPEFHPFNVFDDEAMNRLVRSVERHGVREPGLARPREDGGYELLCGNRRKRACELANIPTMPVIIREMDDDSAAIAMVDSNLDMVESVLEQRNTLLFSERAWAYRVKLDALNHKGIKGDGLSVEVLVEQTGESKNQIFRLIRLINLVPNLLDKVDAKKLAFNPAVELSYLSRMEQSAVVDMMAKYEAKPSLSQAVRLKKMSLDGTLTEEGIDKVFSEEKKPPKSETTGAARYRKYFPADYSPKQMETVIIRLLADWKAGAAV
jgi:ParB family chromosome partitioning protein